MIAYEDRLDADVMWALREGSMHFEDASAVHTSLVKIAARLDELGIPYALAGGMAMFLHGYRRFTEDVDLIVTADGLRAIHEHLDGLGLVPLPGSKSLRDVASGVRIEFLAAGQFPGDGKPKPVAFPNPTAAGETIKGLRVVSLPTLVELKLASGMTNAARLRDLADVQAMIATLALPESLAEQLDPFVREKYRELWQTIRDNPEPPR